MPDCFLQSGRILLPKHFLMPLGNQYLLPSPGSHWSAFHHHSFVFSRSHVNGIIQYIVFCVWRLLLGIICSLIFFRGYIVDHCLDILYLSNPPPIIGLRCVPNIIFLWSTSFTWISMYISNYILRMNFLSWNCWVRGNEDFKALDLFCQFVLQKNCSDSPVF